MIESRLYLNNLYDLVNRTKTVETKILILEKCLLQEEVIAGERETTGTDPSLGKRVTTTLTLLLENLGKMKRATFLNGELKTVGLVVLSVSRLRL